MVPFPMQRFDSNSDFIGLDCLALPENFSGAAYYVYHLAKNLLESPRRFSFAIFCTPKHAPLFSSLLKTSDKMVSVPIKNRAQKIFFYEFQLKSLLIKENVKVFYATHYICPPKSSRYFLINTFHDMGFLLYPQYYPFIKKLYFGRRMKTFLARADRIVAISHSTAAAISRLFPGSASKISVIHSGADHLLAHKTFERFWQQPSLAGKTFQRFYSTTPYILAVNTFERRKNFPFIIRVFNYLKRKYKIGHKLLLIGQPANGLKAAKAEVENSPFKPDITIAHAVSIEELIFYYRHCDFFMNASAYEGFGFTPFEAINFGCPAFLFKNNAISELLGDHLYIFDHLDAEKWAEFIKSEIDNHFQNKILRDAIEHLTWQNTTESVLSLFEKRIPSEEPNLV